MVASGIASGIGGYLYAIGFMSGSGSNTTRELCTWGSILFNGCLYQKLVINPFFYGVRDDINNLFGPKGGINENGFS